MRRSLLIYAKELAHSQSLGLALSNACQFHGLTRDIEALETHAEALACLGATQGFPQYMNLGVLYRGCVLAMRGRIDEGLALYSQGLDATRAAGQERAVPLAAVFLAEGHLSAGRAGGRATGIGAATGQVGTDRRGLDGSGAAPGERGVAEGAA